MLPGQTRDFDPPNSWPIPTRHHLSHFYKQGIKRTCHGSTKSEQWIGHKTKLWFLEPYMPIRKNILKMTRPQINKLLRRFTGYNFLRRSSYSAFERTARALREEFVGYFSFSRIASAEDSPFQKQTFLKILHHRVDKIYFCELSCEQ